MVAPVYTCHVVGIVGYRPRQAWYFSTGAKIVLQVCVKIEMLHPLDNRIVSSHTIWRDAKITDFLPPSLPASQMALAI